MSGALSRYAWWASPRQVAGLALTLSLFLFAQFVAQGGFANLGGLAVLWEGIAPFIAFGLLACAFLSLGKGMMRMAALSRTDGAHLLPDYRVRMRNGMWGWATLAFLAAVLMPASFLAVNDFVTRLGLMFVAVTCCAGLFPTGLDQMLSNVRGRKLDQYGTWLVIPVVLLQYVPGMAGITLQLFATAALLLWAFHVLTARPGSSVAGVSRRPGGFVRPSSSVFWGGSFAFAATFMLTYMLIYRDGGAQPCLAYFAMTSFFVFDPRGADRSLLRLRWLSGSSRMSLLGVGLRDATGHALADLLVISLMLCVSALAGWIGWRDATGMLCQLAVLRFAFLFSGLCWVATKLSYSGVSLRVSFHLGVVLALFVLTASWPDVSRDEFGHALATTMIALAIHAGLFVTVGLWRWRRLEM